MTPANISCCPTDLHSVGLSIFKFAITIGATVKVVTVKIALMLVEWFGIGINKVPSLD